MTPEKKVQNAIVKYLEELEARGEKVIHFRREAIGQAYKKGIPDLYGAINGWHIEIECKREAGGRLSPMQEKKRAEFESRGVLYCAPSSLEEFKNFVKEVFENGK